MHNVIKIAKGSLIGIGLILPGISGAMIAASLYIYEELIVALNKVTQKPVSAVLSIWQYLVGVILGLLVGMFLIQAFLEILLVPITFLFIGFILGGVPKMIKEAKIKEGRFKHYLIFFIMMAIMLSTLLLPERTGQIQGVALYFILIVIGLLTSISMIIPGLSGATILLALGYYHILIDVGTGLVEAILTFDFSLILETLPLAIFIIIGIIIGLVGIGKLVYYILKQKTRYFYFGVLGIVLVSPINVLINLDQSVESGLRYIGIIEWLIAITMLAFGVYLTHQLIKKTSRNIKEM